MTSESKAWQQLKEQYLRQVEKALASVRHPRTRDVLADVGAHLDRRRAELAPDQQTSENLRAIITDMGPPADYAELLEPGTSASAAGSRKIPLGWFAAVGAVLVVGIALILATQLGRPDSEDSIADESGEVGQLIAELSDPNAPRFVALNRLIRIGAPAVPMLIDEMPTNMNWQIPKALGAIGDKRAILPLIEKLETSDFSPMREVVGEALERITGQKLGVAAEQWRAWWEGQKATTGGEVVVVYIVTFKPVPPFAPQTSGELLGAFNEQHPPGVRTHHYRTQVQGGTLIGHICVDTEAGKDAVVAMLNNSAQLVLIEAVLATPEMLEQLYDRGQPSVSASRSRRASRHARKPASRNQTVEQTGAWPPGTCSIRGYVSRPGRFGRPDNAKVCLSSAAFGSWTVEVEDHGMVGFESLPAGTYRLCIADTPGYKDTYYNPLEQDAAKPTFVLREGERIQSRILMEPRRPYRKVTGRVLGVDGSKLTDYTGLTVTAWVQRPQGSWKDHYRRLSTSPVQTDGTYVLDELDGRPVYVQVRDYRPPVQMHPYPPRFYPGTFSRPQAKLVTFGEANVVEEVDIAMADRGGSAIAGRVTEQESGQPVPEALVTIFHHDMFFNLFYTFGRSGRLSSGGAGRGDVHRPRRCGPPGLCQDPEDCGGRIRRGSDAA